MAKEINMQFSKSHMVTYLPPEWNIVMYWVVKSQILSYVS